MPGGYRGSHRAIPDPEQALISPHPSLSEADTAVLKAYGTYGVFGEKSLYGKIIRAAGHLNKLRQELAVGTPRTR